MGKKIILLTLFLVLSSLILLIFLPLASAEIRINEFEQNPPGDDKGNEWVELYSDTQVDLEGWRLMNGDDDIFVLNGTMNGYRVITFPGLWLDNSDEKVILIDSSNSTLDETPPLSDSRNDALAWSLCGNEWKFLNSSKEQENRCSSGGSGGGNNTGNNTGGSGGSGSGGTGAGNGKKKNETIRVRSNLSSSPDTGNAGGNPQISFLEKPSSMEFGQVATVKVRFLADSDYPNLIFFLFSEPKRVVRDFSGEQVTKTAQDASTAISARAYAGEEIEFSLPLKIVENCNKYYPEGEYEISLAGFYSGEGGSTEKKSFSLLPTFPLSLSFNDELCLGTEQLQGKANEKQAQQAQTGKVSSQPLLRSKIIKSIGLWLLIALTAVALFVIWKKKLM